MESSLLKWTLETDLGQRLGTAVRSFLVVMDTRAFVTHDEMEESDSLNEVLLPNLSNPCLSK